ncbi:hypothetical protein EBQ91_01915, partial [bacterium]|nr:hypothetical protein [bacterium]
SFKKPYLHNSAELSDFSLSCQDIINEIAELDKEQEDVVDYRTTATWSRQIITLFALGAYIDSHPYYRGTAYSSDYPYSLYYRPQDLVFGSASSDELVALASEQSIIARKSHLIDLYSRKNCFINQDHINTFTINEELSLANQDDIATTERSNQKVTETESEHGHDLSMLINHDVVYY